MTATLAQANGDELRLIPAASGDAEAMELSNLEEHRQEAERAVGPDHDVGPDVEPDPEQQRVEALKEQSAQRKPDDEEPDAREGAATGQGGPGF
jgi:hypothetical protein